MSIFSNFSFNNFDYKRKKENISNLNTISNCQMSLGLFIMCLNPFFGIALLGAGGFTKAISKGMAFVPTFSPAYKKNREKRINIPNRPRERGYRRAVKSKSSSSKHNDDGGGDSSSGDSDSNSNSYSLVRTFHLINNSVVFSQSKNLSKKSPLIPFLLSGYCCMTLGASRQGAACHV